MGERAEPAYGSEDRSYIRFLVSCFSVRSPPLYIYELHAYFHTPASSFSDPVAPNCTLEPTHKPPWYGVSRALHWLTGHHQFFFLFIFSSATFKRKNKKTRSSVTKKKTAIRKPTIKTRTYGRTYSNVCFFFFCKIRTEKQADLTL